ncbi:MAG: M23 family metallopeptidase [Pyrinomonadaceae bacterium]
MIKSARARVFLGLVIGISSLVVIVAALQKRSGFYQVDTASLRTEAPKRLEHPTPSISTSSPTANEPAPLSEDKPTPNPPPPATSFIGVLKLIIPVAGVRPDQLRDTFSDSRSEGRTHDAIDIPAAQGTPVLSAADGEILKVFQCDLGGTTIYQLSADKKLDVYYAHLQGYADGLFEGKFVRQGEVIGYVGDTGNAGPGNYHLHFSIAVVEDPKRYWEGVNINPYPLLVK